MPDVWEAMTDTAHDRYRKMRRTAANQWRYIKAAHEMELVQIKAIRRRVGVLERELNGHVVIGKPDRR